jgi:hypothetical protein
MTFTALHRVLGLPPGPLTDAMLDEAVATGVVETDDLDWKSELPPVSNLSQTDVPKDIAAMANSGGGMIVYGVEEEQKAATERKDTGEFTENHQRTYRKVAVTAITPPVFGLQVHHLGTNPRAAAVIVPASVDGPHLIYRNDYFGAPRRNNADTEWMKEREIEAAYRARFDERRRSTEALDSLYVETAAGRDTDQRAWLIAVAHPRVPGVLTRPTHDDARQIFEIAGNIALSNCHRRATHPLENLECTTRAQGSNGGPRHPRRCTRAGTGNRRGQVCTTTALRPWRRPLKHTPPAPHRSSRAMKSPHAPSRRQSQTSRR